MKTFRQIVDSPHTWEPLHGIKMIKQEVISYLIDKLNHFQFKGFNIDSTNESVNFSNTNGEVTYKFGVRILRYPDHSRLVSINAGINFHEIEQTIIPILKKAEIVGNSMNSETSNTIGILAEEDLFIKIQLINKEFPIELRQIMDIEKVAQLIQNTYDKIIVEFFKRYNKSEDLFVKLKNRSYRDIASIMTTGGVFKYFLLADKFNKTETEEKMKTWIKRIEIAIENNPNEIQYKRYMNAGNLLMSELNIE